MNLPAQSTASLLHIVNAGLHGCNPHPGCVDLCEEATDLLLRQGLCADVLEFLAPAKPRVRRGKMGAKP